MELKKFESIVNDNRKAFRYILENNLKEVYFRETDEADIEKISFKEWIIRECFGNCTSEFEEQTMMENLKEEFESFILNETGE